MNKKDEEAFEKYNGYGSVHYQLDSDAIREIEQDAFEAGAKHGRAELDELTSILDLKKETIVEMQNAYETLQAHDEMLIATVDKLKEENKKLRDALEFYADHQNWWHDSPSDFGYGSKGLIICIDQAEDIDSLREVSVGGKLARQVLKEVGEE